MEMAMENKYSIDQLLTMLKKAKDVDEIKRIKALFPQMTDDVIKEGHKRLDDGIYDEDGNLIGEKHPLD